MPRVLLIGWDGADWRILDPLLERGDLPNLQALIDRGQRGVLKSTVPTHSWAAWPSFLTGVDPADHGVYDILETVPGTHKQYPVTYRSIKERTFVEDLSAAGKVGVYADVPLMFPPPEIEGKILAGGVLPKGRQYSHPAGLPDELEKAGVPWVINGMSWTTFRNRPGPYLDEALEITGKRIRATEWLMDNSDWDLMASVWVSVDRTQHALSNYVAPDHPDCAKNDMTQIGMKVRDVYKQLDDAIGSFVSRTRSDDLILFISDHGFQSVTRTVHMDHLLKRLGFLEFSASNVVFGPMQWGPVRKIARKAYDFLGLHGKVSLPQSVNWSKTKAFTTIRSTGEGVSINLAGREPDGIVDPADFEKVRDRVMDALSSFTDPATGKKPVKAIYRREEVFKGRHAETAPDILMEPAEQYSLTHAKSAIEKADWISGDHRIDGVIVAAGPAVRPFEQQPLLVDMAPTILAALGAPASIEHTGRILHEVVGLEAKVTRGEESKVTIPGMTGPEESNVTDTEADEMEEHLRGLGYLE
ncbi:MAG TPA: alkaline phosphatase family protein [Acidimicrobiia bacterium]|nr:alkaline phosphatase family protein [Acidimicrobiia bacterium]